jgi:hypothetical protein
MQNAEGPQAPAAASRIAILMTSHSPSAGMSASRPHSFVIDAWHVVQPLLSDVPGSTLHTFLCLRPSMSMRTLPLAEQRERIARAWANFSATSSSGGSGSGAAVELEVVLTESVLGSLQADPWIAPELADFPDQWARLDGCLQAMRRHERERARSFTHVIRARPDVFFVRRAPRFVDLESGKVSLRARALVSETPRPLPFSALTATSGCAPRQFLTRAHTRASEGACGADASVVPAPAHAPFSEHVRALHLDQRRCALAAVEELRRRMRTRRIRACALYDDQFAMMPRSLADAYFALEPGGAGQPNLASFLAYSAEFDARAVRETYGSPTHPDSYLHACPLTGAETFYYAASYRNTTLSWAGTFEEGFKGAFAPTRQAGARDGGLCCEYRLTWRLIGRMVPVSVVPIDFVVAGTRDNIRRWERIFARAERNDTVVC